VGLLYMLSIFFYYNWTTIGYRDLHFVKPIKVSFDIFYMLFNLGLITYFIGNISNLVVEGASHPIQFISFDVYKFFSHTLMNNNICVWRESIGFWFDGA
jgi:hypothetical protein